MAKKTDLPIALWKQLESYVNLHGERFEVVDSEKVLLHIEDCNKESGFFFDIEKDVGSASNGKKAYIIASMPKNDINMPVHRRTVILDEIGNAFKKWIELLEQFESLVTFLDDPIIQAYADGYFADFEIIEPDKPLEPQKILLLDERLAYIAEKLSEYEEDENKAEIAVIIEETNNLRKIMTRISKGKAFKYLANILARITKLGPKYINMFVGEVVKQLAKGVTEAVIGK